MADAPAVHELLLSAREEIPLPDSFDAHRQWVRERCRHNRVRMCERNGALAGVAVMEGDEIAFLVTAPAHRRAGVAAALIEDAKVRVWRKYRKPAHLRMRADNAPMIRLMEKLGLVPDLEQALRPGWVCYRISDSSALTEDS